MKRDSVLQLTGNTHGQLFFVPKIRERILDLTSKNIDTIGVFMVTYVGYESDDTCDCDLNAWTCHIFWIENSVAFEQKISACCETEPTKGNSDAFFLFYYHNAIEINNEVIFPVITSTETDKNGNIDLHILDHGAEYDIFCKYGSFKTFITFRQEEIENENNIYHNDNINSKINAWRNIIQE